MLTRETAINIATKFVLDCIKSGVNIEKAIIFGSFAKNQQKEFSDIDIALVSGIFDNNFLKNNQLTSKINIKYPDIEAHHFNSTYFNAGDPFIEEITKTGFEINLNSAVE
jgi:predicted nucleotidyltransferase